MQVLLVDTVIAGFLNSPEFASKGLSNEQFVTQLYQGILDRNPDSGGLNGWVSALNTGQLSKIDVTNGFLNSPEFQQKRLVDNVTVGNVSDNIFWASSGSDQFFGESGFDTLDYRSINGGITLLSQGQILKQFQGTTDQIFGIERIIASGDSNAINMIDGSGDNGQTSFDIDLSQQRLTVLNIPFIGSATFTIENFDNITGTTSQDIIVGDSQSNRLTGRGGNDLLTGGLGNDFFIFNSITDGIDRILDFNANEGDKIFVSFGKSLGNVSTVYDPINQSSDLFFFGTKLATLENLSSANDFIVSRDVLVV
jgi:Ca2+-binding RTX toxin-like protein